MQHMPALVQDMMLSEFQFWKLAFQNTVLQIQMHCVSEIT
jgi:hypothetical protein